MMTIPCNERPLSLPSQPTHLARGSKISLADFTRRSRGILAWTITEEQRCELGKRTVPVTKSMGHAMILAQYASLLTSSMSVLLSQELRRGFSDRTLEVSTKMGMIGVSQLMREPGQRELGLPIS